ncbi:MAG TPA: hypothetical protein VGD76_12380 [Ramlibacter sp.]
MSYITSFLAHAGAVRLAAESSGAVATVQLSDYGLCLLKDGRETRWPPKFVARMHGRLVYTPVLVPGTAGFAGWSPYAIRQWPLATSKSAFKRHAIERGIATPAACFDPGRIQGPFLVKHDASSFGEGMRGPFLAYDPDDPAHQLRPGEYYENFIVGLIAKAWCWGGECLALHLEPPGTVTGDGQASVRDHVLALGEPAGTGHDWGLVERLVRCCGIGSLDEVLPRGRQVLIEFRYGSRYADEGHGNPNLLGRMRDRRLVQQFADAARQLAHAIPPDAQHGPAYYTLDAMVDSAGDAWFLEMNCNPVVHPDLYARMLAGAFGTGAEHARVPAAGDLLPA